MGPFGRRRLALARGGADLRDHGADDGILGGGSGYRICSADRASLLDGRLSFVALGWIRVAEPCRPAQQSAGVLVIFNRGRHNH